MRKNSKIDKKLSYSKNNKGRNRRRKLDSDMDSNSNNNINNLGNDIKLRTNDPSWYMHNASLAEAAGSIPFSYALGAEINAYASNPIVLPGLCALRLVPSFGRALYKTDPINVAATQIYSYVRHANSGHSNYQAPDLMMYMLAMGQAYSCHEWMKRIFGYLNTYSVTNKYIPRAYAEADWIDFDDFIANKANLHYFINETAVKLSAFAIPQNLDLFKRHRYIYSNIHLDDVTSRSSLYMFVPDGFYKFDNVSSETGTRLSWSEWSHTGDKHTVEDLINYVNDLLALVFGDEDAGIMSGDILKAYGQDSIFQAEAITFDYSVLPIYDLTILSQIHNASIYSPIEAHAVSQTPSGVIQNQQLTTITTAYPKETSVYSILDTHLDNPTPADVLEMSRLVARKNNIAGRDDVMSIVGGSELVSSMTIFTFDYTTDNYVGMDIYGSGLHASAASTYRVLLDQWNKLSKFNHHPLIHIIDTGNNNAYIVLGDLDNVTSIGWQQMENLHTTALLSLFGV